MKLLASVARRLLDLGRYLANFPFPQESSTIYQRAKARKTDLDFVGLPNKPPCRPVDPSLLASTLLLSRRRHKGLSSVLGELWNAKRRTSKDQNDTTRRES